MGRQPTDRSVTGPVAGPSGGSTDAELLARSLLQPDVFGELFDRHAAPVGRFIARRTFGSQPVEDLLAETFFVAFQLRERFDRSSTSARPWLLGIATNVVRRQLRDEARRWRALARLDPDDADRAVGPFEELIADRVDALRVGTALAAALAQMRDDDREALLLLSWGGLSYAEIAIALEIPVGTVRSRLFRARRQLRATLASQGINPPRADSSLEASHDRTR